MILMSFEHEKSRQTVGLAGLFYYHEKSRQTVGLAGSFYSIPV